MSVVVILSREYDQEFCVVSQDTSFSPAQSVEYPQSRALLKHIHPAHAAGIGKLMDKVHD